MTRVSGESSIMQRVIVLDPNKEALMPCHPARARKLLAMGKAAVYRRYPFTIILKAALAEPELQAVELKVDPGSKTTGIALVANFKRGRRVLWAANLDHRGQVVKQSLEKRRHARRSRRRRKSRYRPARFDNRTRPKGWLAPSLRSRVDNVFNWSRKLVGLVPVTSIVVETVRFDTHKLVNPEVSGVMYQQGQLQGYEVRQYLLEKWGRRCAYCDVANVPLEVEHITAKSRGGSDRVSNLTLFSHQCNQDKSNRDVREFLADKPDKLKVILAQARQPLKDAAAINSIRYAIGDQLKTWGLPVSFWSGGRTKHNRVRQGYEKEHWIDAACVGETGEQVHIPAQLKPLGIKARGRGSRQMCRMDRYGFPRTGPKSTKRVHGFQTGDLVKAVVPQGKKVGTHIGRIAVRASGSFRVGVVDGINERYCCLWQRTDGYEYAD